MQQDVTRRARIGFLQLRFEAELADQCEQRGRALKTLRAGFEKKAVFLDGIDQAAGAVVRFENGDVKPSCCRRYAQARPEMPAPITATCVGLFMNAALQSVFENSGL